MADPKSAKEAKRETVPASAAAERLCVVVFKNGKADGQYAMSFDDLVMSSRYTFVQVATALDAALRRDWLGRKKSGVVLKAAGVHVAKKALGLLA